MKAVYRVLAILISVEVVVQAAAIAYALFGLTRWIDNGNTLDKAAVESDSTSFTGVAGFMVHGINGQLVIPLLAVVLLLVSFFAKVPRGVMWAGVVLLLVVIQVVLGILGHSVPGLGMLHGINALLLFAAAGMASRQAATRHEHSARHWGRRRDEPGKTEPERV